MSESTFKMIGLALMMLSVFMILFGLCFLFTAQASIGLVLAWSGLVVLLGGSIMFFVIRKK